MNEMIIIDIKRVRPA